MTNDREKTQQQQTENANEENTGGHRTEQFNELSELSLEERMNVADQLGVPVDSAGDAAATGTITGNNDTASPDNEMEEKTSSEEADR